MFETIELWENKTAAGKNCCHEREDKENDKSRIQQNETGETQEKRGTVRQSKKSRLRISPRSSLFVGLYAEKEHRVALLSGNDLQLGTPRRYAETKKR